MVEEYGAAGFAEETVGGFGFWGGGMGRRQRGTKGAGHTVQWKLGVRIFVVRDCFVIVDRPLGFVASSPECKTCEKPFEIIDELLPTLFLGVPCCGHLPIS